MVEPPTPTAALTVGAITFTSRPMIPSARALMRYRGPIFSPDSLSTAFDALLVIVLWRRRVRVCVYARVRVCVRVRACVCVRVRACLCVCLSEHA